MKPLLALFVLALVLSSCQEQLFFCDVNNLGKFCFENRTDDTLSLYLDGSLVNFINPQSDLCEFVSIGNRAYRVESPGILTWTDTLTVGKCDEIPVPLND